MQRQHTQDATEILPRVSDETVVLQATILLFHRLTPLVALTTSHTAAGMVKRYHGSFPSFSYGFDSRYPLQLSYA